MIKKNYLINYYNNTLINVVAWFLVGALIVVILTGAIYIRFSQIGGDPQSTGQLAAVSLASHIPFPQVIPSHLPYLSQSNSN